MDRREARSSYALAASAHSGSGISAARRTSLRPAGRSQGFRDNLWHVNPTAAAHARQGEAVRQHCGEPADGVANWAACPAPERSRIEGHHVVLEPLGQRHCQDLFNAFHGAGEDPELWDHLPYGPFDRASWAEWLATASASEDPLFFAVIDRCSGAAAGQLALMRIVPEHGSVEIGHVVFGPAMQRSVRSTEAVFLAARYAFDQLGYRRLEWKCDSRNARSAGAAERFGFTFEGVFRQHMVVKGRNRDTSWFSILDCEWPRVSESIGAWLAPDNFDGEGRQRESLAAIRERL